MSTLATTPTQPYVPLHLQHFPTSLFNTPSGAEIHPMWSGEGNLSYLIVNPTTREAVLIDPDLEILGSYLLTLDMQALKLVAVMDTHTHAEHATAAPTLHKITGATYLMNHHAPSSFVSDRLKDDDERMLAGYRWHVHYAPGHTPDLQTVALGNHLFTGDSLFSRSSGRPDLPGGDAGLQFETLQHILTLPNDTIIHPGHDYNNRLSTTLGEARKENPRLQFHDRQAFVEAMAAYYAHDEKPDNLEYYVGFNAR